MLERLWSSRVPKNIFEGLHYPPTWSNRFLRWERQKRCYRRKRQGPMAKECCDDVCLKNVVKKFSGKRR